ncbi:GEVED domain-containing protein [Psychroserpens sp. MEBiC05023]
MKKNYSLILLAFLCFVVSSYGQYTGTGSFTQINSLAELTDGYYVIAYNDQYAMNNTHNGTYLARTTINPIASEITDPSGTIVWRVETNGSGKTIYNEASAKYVSYTGSSNNVQIVDNVISNNQRWTISYSGGEFIVSNLAVTTRDLQYNTGAPRFACYTGSQQDLTFYRMAISTDPSLSISGTPLDHGSACLNTANPIQTYTIANSSSSTLTANNVTVTSDDTQFVVSNYTPNNIAVGGSSTFDVTFTPTSAGVQTATITVASTTGTSNSPTINLTGTGLDVVSQAVTTNAASAIGGTLATLNGNVNTVGTCPNTIEKGFVYSETITNANPLIGGTGVTGTSIAGISTGNFTFGATGLTISTNYSYKAYVYDGSTYTYGAIETFTTTTPPPNDDCATLAPNITVGAAPITGDLSNASPSASLSQQPTKNDVWYSFTPACTGVQTILTTFTSGPDIDLYVYDTNCPSSGNALYSSTSGNNTDETLTNTFTAGTTYYIRVLDYFNDASNFNISINTDAGAPNNGRNIEACLGNTSVELSWDASTGTAPTGYIVFAQQGTTSPASATPGNASSYIANTNYATANTYGFLGRAVYKGNGTSTTVTGLTNGLDYTFKVVAYFCESATGWATAINASGSWDDTYTVDVPEANITGASVATTSSVITWTNPLPTTCYDVLIVANEGGITPFTPSSGTSYTGNPVYAGADSIVFFGNGTTTTVTGLTDGVTYCYTLFIRNQGTDEWSNGQSICQTTGLSYCNSSGGTSTNSGILNVNLNTLNNSSASNNAYTDFTAVSTSLILGDQYNLSVNVNTGGNYTANVKVWIDWNRDGSFNNSSNEAFELGTITNSSNAQPSLSPITVTVPTNAYIGNVRMRVSSKTDNGEPYATPCEDFSFGEVEDYTITIVQPSNAEINIEGNNISIPNGYTVTDLPTAGLNQTLYGLTSVGAMGPEKIYTIENIGATTLNLNGTPRVQLTGAHPGDFNVTVQPSATVNSLATSEFRIQFNPTSDGIRTATVSIPNSDSNESPYEFQIQGSANCTSTLTSSIWPTSGPENTEVTITSATNLTGATATINGLSMTTVSSSATELVVLIPQDATTDDIIVTFSTGCSSVNPFTVIDDLNTTCDFASANTLNELFISEITDAENGSSSFVEIYNGTPNTVNLSDYRVDIFNNGSPNASSENNLTGNLASGSTYVITVGSTSCTTFNNLSVTPSQSFGSSSGINFNNNSSDAIGLYKISTATMVDIFGLYESDNWANGLGVGSDGANFRRKNDTSPLPNPTEYHFDINEWEIYDWTDCSDSDYVNIGNYNISNRIPPDVSALATPTFDCTTTVQLSVMGNQGVPAGQQLNYQWYYLVPNTPAFVEVPNGPDFNNNVTNSSLDITNPIPYIDYQFFCQVREDDVNCYVASNAVKLNALGAVWDGTNWSASPASDKIVIIDGDYDTSIGTNGETSFEACQLIVNTGRTLNIENNTYVRVQNNLTVNGNIVVKTDGSFVQVDDTAIVNGDVLSTPSRISVEKETANLATYQEYTYWSTPVSGETIGGGLFESSANRRFWFNAQNFRDSTQETNNNDATLAGQDDIDDDGNDWQPITDATTVMSPGVGYASTHNSTGFTPNQYIYTFEGPFNNGVFNIPIYRNDAEPNDNNWNFIGNPYPSAIDADLFLAANASIDQTVGATNGAIFFWSHNTAADENTNGNEVLNYSQSDYAIINGSGQTMGGDMVMPTRHIPSGQGFFVSMDHLATSTSASGSIRTTNIVFNNSMRVIGNNNQFFRTINNANVPNKLWLDLNSDNGVFNQVLIAYVDGATNDDDGMYYDAHKNLSSNANSIIYSLIDELDDKKFAIQGKSPTSLNLSEVIPLGFYTKIEEATLYTISIHQVEGEFMNENTIYINDKLLGITHDLSANDYSFTSETGEFNNRFEIVFQEDALSVSENDINSNDLTIVELSDGNVKFSVGHNLVIEQVEIIDLIGRTIYKLQGSNTTETYNLSRLSQATYIAKVSLSNGQIITKKAVKRK